jgi:hypothetical protein
VWVSSSAGKSWTRLTAAAPFAERDNFNAEVTTEGYIVVTGGYNSRETLNDGRTNAKRLPEHSSLMVAGRFSD